MSMNTNLRWIQSMNQQSTINQRWINDGSTIDHQRWIHDESTMNRRLITLWRWMDHFQRQMIVSDVRWTNWISVRYEYTSDNRSRWPDAIWQCSRGSQHSGHQLWLRSSMRYTRKHTNILLCFGVCSNTSASTILKGRLWILEFEDF